jgi:hypothetical protein
MTSPNNDLKVAIVQITTPDGNQVIAIEITKDAERIEISEKTHELNNELIADVVSLVEKVRNHYG